MRRIAAAAAMRIELLGAGEQLVDPRDQLPVGDECREPQQAASLGGAAPSTRLSSSNPTS